MSAEPQIIATNDSPSSRSGSEDVVRDWMERLEDRVRNFPEESILISFLLGGLLQIGVIRALLLNFLRLALVLATPILFGFAIWRLYQSFAERR
jgi:predicted alpha/beta hydrolase family esterase